MAFEGLSEKLSNVFKKLRGKGKLTAADVKQMAREIKMALLEADVNYKVVKDFVAVVSERAVGAEVLESLTPAQQVIKIVNEELTKLLGTEQSKLKISSKPPTIVMLVGLQGAGKTTHIAKLANLFKNQQQKRPLMVACDVQRPAAIEQLRVLGEKNDLPVYFDLESKDPVGIANAAIAHAKKNGNDIVFVDTAGRLHVDEELMDELKRMKETLSPTEILLTIDAMTGQDAVNVAKSFNDALGITGVILTKTDGDTRGGAALSVKSVTNMPIKFVGVGEKISDIEPFYPERMASRILGMGDVLTLIEKAQQNFDEKKALELAQKVRKNSFTLTDFLDQIQQMKNMGGLDSMLSMMPGMNQKALANATVDEKQIARTEAIIHSMTKKEQENPAIINASRKRRIAQGSGTKIEEVNRLLKQFSDIQRLMKQMSTMGKNPGKLKRAFPFF